MLARPHRQTATVGRGRSRTAGRDDGFALVFVVWCIGLLSLLFVAYVVAAKYRSVEAMSIAARARADAFANTAVRLAIFDLLARSTSDKIASQRFATTGRPVHCALAAGARTSISISDEGGKVDLNTANPELIRLLLASVYDKPAAERITKRIIAVRSPETMSAGPNQPPPIRTVMEMDQLAGDDGANWVRLIALATVHSQSAGIDPDVATPQMRDVIAPAVPPQSPIGPIPADFTAVSLGRTFSIGVETIAGSARSRVEAIVEFGAQIKGGFRILEWRNENPRLNHEAIPAAGLPAC